MRSIVNNERLYKAIRAYARRHDLDYPDAVKQLAERVGYKSHRKIYDFVRCAARPGGRKMFLISQELKRSVDHLFGEG